MNDNSPLGRPVARSGSPFRRPVCFLLPPAGPRPLRLSPLEWEIGTRSSCLPVRREIGGKGPCRAATPPNYHHRLPVDPGSVMTHRRDRPASPFTTLPPSSLFSSGRVVAPLWWGVFHLCHNRRPGQADDELGSVLPRGLALDFRCNYSLPVSVSAAGGSGFGVASMPPVLEEGHAVGVGNRAHPVA